MHLFKYSDLDESGRQTQYKRVIKNRQNGNFATADVQKNGGEGTLPSQAG